LERRKKEKRKRAVKISEKKRHGRSSNERSRGSERSREKVWGKLSGSNVELPGKKKERTGGTPQNPRSRDCQSEAALFMGGERGTDS